MCFKNLKKIKKIEKIKKKIKKTQPETRNPENLGLALNGIRVIRQVQRAYQKIDWLVIKINLC